MNVIINIKGQEAIPVRAIPLLSNWRFMSPDVVAHVLGGTGGSNVSLFGDMKSYRVENGQVHSIRQDWWAQFPLRRLQALTKQIAATESTHEVGYSDWQEQSLKELPAGLFVWKDDYQDLHEKSWNSQHDVLLRGLQCLNSQDDADDTSTNLTSEELADDSSLPDDMRESIEILKRWHKGNLSTLMADGVSLTLYLRESIEILKRWREPDFSPFMNADLQQLVMEGFEGLLTGSTASAQTITTAPVVAIDALTEHPKAVLPALKTRVMADSFAGLHWNGEQWMKKLGKNLVWLDACIVLRRAQGEGARQWNPVLIGAYLVHKGYVEPRSVRAKFRTQDALKPWLNEWKIYEDDNWPND